MLDQRKWSLNPQVVNQLFICLGLLLYNLFTSRTNSCFSSSVWKEILLLSIECFSQTWNQFAYFFPLHALLLQVVSKIKQDQAAVILITPYWPQSPWVLDLLQELVDLPIRLPVLHDLLQQHSLFHPDPQFWQLAAWKVAGIIFKLI